MEREKPNFDILELWSDAIDLINMAQKKPSAQRNLD